MRRLLTVLGVACLLLSTTSALAQETGSEPETAKGVTSAEYTETITEEYRVETDHGLMYGWVERPDPEAYPELYETGQGTSGGGVPVVLVLSPYNVIYQPVAWPTPPVLHRGDQGFFVPRGYAYAQFDVVGTRDSGGCYDYGGLRERETGAAVVDFLGSQEWSNGKVGMIGGSYDGTTQFAAAVENPKHLAAIIPQVAIDRWYDYAFGGGVRYFLNSEKLTDEGFDTPLAFDFGFALTPPSAIGGGESTALAQVVADRITPCDELLHTQHAYDPDPIYDEFWLERDYNVRAGNVTAAVLIEGGWQDDNVKHWDSTQMFMALPDTIEKRLVMGQWGHSTSQFPDAQNIRHAWFDEFLLGFDTGVGDIPEVDTQPFNGTRVQHTDWPPPTTVPVEIPLTASGETTGLALANADEPSWTDDNPLLTEDEIFAQDCAGACIVFASEPLPTDLRISGGPTLHLTATSDDVSTHLVPVLFSIDDSGAATVIERGFLNTRMRGGLDTSEPLTPGEAYEAPVPIWDTDHIVPAGERLAVGVQSANAYWALHDDDTLGVTTTLELGGASFLKLPVSEGAEAFGTTPAPGPAPAPDAEQEPLPTTGGGLAALGVVLLAAAGIAGPRRRS